VREPDLTGTRYTLGRLLGAGGMGAVYEAHDPALDRTVALKVLELGDEGGAFAERLVQEARILGRLEHPGIVPVHEVGTLADGRIFYAMKRVDGERLDAHAARVPSLAERLRVFLRVAETVAFAHSRGVLHRDLTPANVMVGSFGEVLVIDWGLARALPSGPDPSHRAGSGAARPGTAAGSVLGTPGWMSPEQLAGAPVDERTDVYALGRLLAFLAGPAPPRALRAISEKAAAPAPEGRYASAAELARDVAAWLAGEPVAADPEGLSRKALRILSKHRVAALLVAAYLVARGVVLLALKR
jgi:serine/threonine protein kinase